MTTLESRKYSLISAIIDDANEDRVFEIERLYSQEPCVYTDNELQNEVSRRMKDYREGKVTGTPHEQIKRRIV
jgi:putative addiction module component (TIGR02574 family)